MNPILRIRSAADRRTARERPESNYHQVLELTAQVEELEEALRREQQTVQQLRDEVAKPVAVAVTAQGDVLYVGDEEGIANAHARGRRDGLAVTVENGHAVAWSSIRHGSGRRLGVA
jgi:hypothetical protein